MTNDSLPETGFVRLPQILRHLPIGRSTWWAGVKAGKFPRAVKLSDRITVWYADEINALLAELGKGAAKSGKAPPSVIRDAGA